MMDTGIYERDTIYYFGNISYDKNTENEIIFNFNDTNVMKLEVDEAASLFSPCGPLVGKFDDNDRLSIDYCSSVCPYAPLGAATCYDISGTRK